MKANHKKKVLFFLPGGVGGAERMTVTIAKMLPRDRFDVKFVVVGRLKKIYDFIPEDYPCDCIPVRNIYCAATLRIWWKIMRENADYVFSSLQFLNVRLIGAALLTGAKAIVRNDNKWEFASKGIRTLMKITYPYAHRVIAQQEEMRDELLIKAKLSSDKCIVLHNPLDTKTIDEKIKETVPFERKNNDRVYVSVGRIFPIKGTDILCRAFAKVCESFSNAQLYIVGAYKDTPFYHEVINFINDNNLKDNVTLVGYDANPYRWLKGCDCFVLSSRLEGLPNVLIEAQYLGKPAVATNCVPVINRIIDEGKTGFIVPVDDVVAMAEAMIKAPLLGTVTMTYKPATVESFIDCFQE